MSSEKSAEDLFNFWWAWFLQVDEKNRYTFVFSSKNCAKAGWDACVEMMATQIHKERAAKVVELPEFTTEEIDDLAIAFSFKQYGDPEDFSPEPEETACSVGYLAGFRAALRMMKERVGK